MKETKSAEFKSLVVEAKFDSGQLAGLVLAGTTLDATEATDLATWLNTTLQINPHLQYPKRDAREFLDAPVVGEGRSVPEAPKPDVNDPLNPPSKAGLTDLPKIEDRTTSKIILPGNEKKITDAESVKNRIPIEKALAASGMALETRVVAPIQVRIEK